MANNDIIRHSDIAEDNLMQPLRSEIALTIKELNNLDSELIKMATDLKKALGQSGFGSEDALRKFNNQVTLSNEVLKQSVAVKNEVIKTEAAYVIAVSNITNELDDNRVALEKLKKENKDDAKLRSEQVGAYDKLAIALNRNKKEYKDLFILQKEGSIRGKELKASIDAMEVSIRSADAAVHQHQRNVGNYGNSFNGLSNSVNQLTREMPAFANSAQTGFMAISNNLPIFIDNINQLKEKNAALNAEGKAGIPVWKQVLSSLFSWETAMGVGITLLVTYGKEIGAGIKALFGFTKSTETQEEAQLRLNKAYDDGTQSLKEMNDYVNGQIDFNTKINVLKEKQAGASQEKINEIERKGREDGIKNAEKHFFELTDLYARQTSQLSNLSNGDLSPEDLKAQQDAINANIKKTEADIETTRRLVESLKYQSGIAEQQLKVDAIENAKQRAKEQAKLDEEARKRREQEALAALEIQHQLNVAIIEATYDGNKEKVKLINENLDYEMKVNQIKIKNYDKMLKINIAATMKADEEIKNLLKNTTKIDEVEEIERDQAILKKAQKFLVDKRKKEEADELKAKQSLTNKVFQITKSSLDKENALKQRAVDTDIAASQRREDALRAIAAKGAQNSQENLAFELRKQAELQAQKDKLIKKQIQQERALALLKALSSGNLNGSKNVDSIINSLPSFYEGTEDTGSANNPLDENGGRLAILHDNEAVLKKDLNKKRQKSGLSLDKTIDYALNYQALINPTSFDKIPMSNHVNDDRQLNKLDEVKSEISELKNVIQNRPIKDWDVNKTEKLIELKLIEGGKTTNIQRKSGGLFR